MSASPVSLLSDLIAYLETLYPVLLNLTVRAQVKHTDMDKQIAIEETRTDMLAEAREIVEKVGNLLNHADVASSPDVDLAELEKKIETFLSLLTQVQSIDQKRICAFREEWGARKQELHDVHLGKQAVTLYQKSALIKD